MRDSAEDSDDETRQPPNAVASTSKEINKTPPPRDSDTGSPTQYLNMKIHVMILSLLKKMFRG